MCVCASVYLRYFASDILKIPVMLVFLGSTLSPLPLVFHQTMFFLFFLFTSWFLQLIISSVFLKTETVAFLLDRTVTSYPFLFSSRGVVCSAAIWRPFSKNISPSFHLRFYPTHPLVGVGAIFNNVLFESSFTRSPLFRLMVSPSFLLSEHIPCKESTVIVQKFHIEILTY